LIRTAEKGRDREATLAIYLRPHLIAGIVQPFKSER